MLLETRNVTSSQPLIELACVEDVEYKIGSALVVTAGVAELATGADVPTHICNTEKVGKEGEFIYGYLVLEDMVFEANLAADGSDLEVGDKVTIDTDGVGVTATTTDGTAEIVAFATGDKSKGAPVLVRFAQ